MSGTPVDPPPEFLKELIDICHEMSNWRLWKDREGLYILDEYSDFGRAHPRAHIFLRFESDFNVFCHTSNFNLRSISLLIIALLGCILGIWMLFVEEGLGLLIIVSMFFLIILDQKARKQSQQSIDLILKRISMYPKIILHRNQTYERIFGLGQFQSQEKQSLGISQPFNNKNAQNKCPNCRIPIPSSEKIFCDECGILLK